MKKRRIVLVLVTIAAIVAAMKFATATRPAPSAQRHLVDGDVVGFEDRDDTFTWRGIPFASPPTGDLRWRAPRPAAPWQGVREALEPGPMCSQALPIPWPESPIVLGSEDCLYLDVTTPRLAAEELGSAGLPVMVWIHGGANTLGTSGATQPFRLVGEQQVIVVSLQYRLGILGWMSHPALRKTADTELDGTANFAVLDMIAALQWVRSNIAAFGGDPDNVTIFGQSAGAFDVLALLVSPPAKGLFQRAISQSGNIQTVPQAMAENYRDAPVPGLPESSREFVNNLLVADGRAADRDGARAVQDGMTDAELAGFLRSRSADQLFGAVVRRGSLGYFTPTNIRDGLVLPREPVLEILSDPTRYNRVPVILGTNRDEYKLFLWAQSRFSTRRFGIIPRLKDPAEFDRITGYFSDQWQAIGVNEPAAVLAQSQPGEVFAYRFDWSDQSTMAGTDMSELFGAAHGIEVTFLFGPDAVDTLPLFAITDHEQARDELGAAMRDYWASFARNGVPGNGGDARLPVWRPWGESSPAKLIFDTPAQGGIRLSTDALTVAALKVRLRQDPAIKTPRERCELFAQLFYYAMTTDFWSDEEYSALGCDAYPVGEFKGII